LQRSIIPALILGLVLQTAKLAVNDPRVAVSVSAPTRDGFVDTSKEIEDSVKDLAGKLKDQGFLVASGSEAKPAADLVVTVVARGTGSQEFGSRLTYTNYYGSAVLTNMPIVANTRWVSVVMEIGTYKKEFSAGWTNASSLSGGAWSKDADRIAKDIAAWAKANLTQIQAKRN
jgi:hypothetical protein